MYYYGLPINKFYIIPHAITQVFTASVIMIFMIHMAVDKWVHLVCLRLIVSKHFLVLLEELHWCFHIHH